MCRFGDGTIAAIAEDFNAITVAIQPGGSAEIMGYLSRESLSFPVISDPDGALATIWGYSAYPSASCWTAAAAYDSLRSAIPPESGYGDACVGNRHEWIRPC